MNTKCCHQNTCSNESHVIRNWCWVIVRLIVATVLAVAATLKCYQLVTTLSLGDSIFETRWFQILLVECEFALAVILLFGIIPKISWLVTTILFTVLSVVSLFRGLSGAESCGCFGAVQVILITL